MDRYRPLRLALKRMAVETRAERLGLSPETCLKLADVLATTLVGLADDLEVPPETLAQALLKKWRVKQRKEPEYVSQS